MGQRAARTPQLQQLAAELVLRYFADDAAHSVSPGEIRRATNRLAKAARLYVSVVPGPTRKKIAA